MKTWFITGNSAASGRYRTEMLLERGVLVTADDVAVPS